MSKNLLKILEQKLEWSHKKVEYLQLIKKDQQQEKNKLLPLQNQKALQQNL